MSLGKCMQSSDHHFSEDTECFLYPYRSLCPFAISPIPMPLALGNNTSNFSVSSFAFSRMSCIWNVTCCPFCLASFTLHNAFEVPPQCCLCQRSFPFNPWRPFSFMSGLPFVYLPVEWCSACFQWFAIVNKVTGMIPVRVFVGTYVFTSLEEMLRRGVVGSYSKRVVTFVGTIVQFHR